MNVYFNWLMLYFLMVEWTLSESLHVNRYTGNEADLEKLVKSRLLDTQKDSKISFNPFTILKNYVKRHPKKFHFCKLSTVLKLHLCNQILSDPDTYNLKVQTRNHPKKRCQDEAYRFQYIDNPDYEKQGIKLYVCPSVYGEPSYLLGETGEDVATLFVFQRRDGDEGLIVHVSAYVTDINEQELATVLKNEKERRKKAQRDYYRNAPNYGATADIDETADAGPLVRL